MLNSFSEADFLKAIVEIDNIPGFLLKDCAGVFIKPLFYLPSYHKNIFLSRYLEGEADLSNF
jgi:hypothetical protein